MKDQFVLAPGSYLLNHSVGRPLADAEANFSRRFFSPWQDSGREPWGDWLGIIDDFRNALASLFNSRAELFCPQVNLSAALTKIVMSHPRLQAENCVVLMSESDFPSMGFAMQKALAPGAEIRFIAAERDLSDPQTWQDALAADIDLVFISHAYSNTGQQAPVADILDAARKNNTLTIVDVAQSAGVLALDLTRQTPDFMIGSSVKWLCGGPGAAYLWVSPERLDECSPRDVGWFSHRNPFEFDIHRFAYHDSALRFWGGTPSVAPYAIAAHSIAFFAGLGVDKVREHNLKMGDMIIDGLGEYLVSPKQPQRRSGTLILHFGERQAAVVSALSEAGISIDERAYGIRVSPHVYNDEADIGNFIAVVNKVVC